MGLAKAGGRYPEFIYHMQAIYIALGRSLERTEQFFVQEVGLPQRNWDDIPKTLVNYSHLKEGASSCYRVHRHKSMACSRHLRVLLTSTYKNCPSITERWTNVQRKDS